MSDYLFVIHLCDFSTQETNLDLVKDEQRFCLITISKVREPLLNRTQSCTDYNQE